MTTEINPPYTPSHDLFGLIVGASLRRPNLRPEKYAAVSASHTMSITATSSHGERACSCAIATHTATSSTTPIALIAAAPRVLHSFFSHNGAMTIQNTDARPQMMTTGGIARKPVV